MVGLQVLVLAIGVRIPVPEQIKEVDKIHFFYLLWNNRDSNGWQVEREAKPEGKRQSETFS